MKKMKKAAALLLCMAMAVAMTACGGKSDSKSNKKGGQ